MDLNLLIDKMNKLSVCNTDFNVTESDGLIKANDSVMKINVVHNALSGTQTNCTNVSNVLSYRQIFSTTREFIEIQNAFAKQCLSVKSVVAVVNPYIKQSFELKRQYHYDNAHPLLLYHGTKEKYVDSICTYNFNWRYSGSENGFKYGKGVNFSSKPFFSAFFCEKSNGVIIIADVLIKTISPGSQDLLLPPEGSDTTFGKKKTIFVKFDDNEFYPKYVVRFKRNR